MEIGIIGLPKSGKTTIFNAVTKGNVAVSGYSNKANVGVAKVPDQRVDVLARMYRPIRVVPAEITFTDVPPPPEGFGKTKGISGEYLNAVQAVDALLIVIRAFDNSSVSHVYETNDPIRDTESMLMEITFSDLDILDRRLERIQSGFKGISPPERTILIREQELLLRIKEDLNLGVSLKDQQLSSDEIRQISGFGFLSVKPLIIVINIGEEQLEQHETLEKEYIDTLSSHHVRPVVLCAQLEMELSQMDTQEEEEFRKDLGIIESSLHQMVRLSYDVVDQISFFTVGEDEVRAWEIHRNTIAQQAAGKIHSDLQRGFIRAEVISYDNLVKCGGFNQARKLGLLRQEGKEYIIEDGEIMHVLFNI